MRKLFALGFAAALVVAACGPAGPGDQTGPAKETEADIALSGPVEAVLWHNQTGASAKNFEDMVALFNSSNGKGITIKPEVQGNYTQIYQKMLGAIQAGAMPDGVVAVENQVADYAKAGVIVNIDQYIDSKKNGLSKESLRSEERRVGKECRSRWSPEH